MAAVTQSAGGERSAAGVVVCVEALVCVAAQCCSENGCCTYYYQLWWFWIVWLLVLLCSCCCVYRHRRAKLRLQQQRQQEINLLTYQRACSSTSTAPNPGVLATLKLPSYEEVTTRPRTPPPPYSAVFVLQGGALHALPSSYSSGNCTSCSYDSCSLSCSSSFSGQVTDEMLTSEATTPSGETCMGVSFPELRPMQSHLAPSLPISPPYLLLQEAPSSQEGGGGAGGGGSCADGATSFLPNTTLVSSSTNEPRQGSREDRKENCFRHRSLTGDSGIEVCRCHMRREEDEDEELRGRWRVGELDNHEDCWHRTWPDCSQGGRSTANQTTEELSGDVEASTNHILASNKR